MEKEKGSSVGTFPASFLLKHVILYRRRTKDVNTYSKLSKLETKMVYIV